MKSSGSSYNNLYIAFAKKYIDKKAVACACKGDSFYSDDHERGDIDNFYLRKKADNLGE